jgi:uncharacterized protein (TIGR02453 family)
MLQTSTFSFLTDLKANNNREWFAEHKADYEQAKTNFEGFIDSLLPQLIVLEEKFVHLKAKETTFRIYRDVRFSKEKTPFKPHFSAYFNKGGKGSELAGYYFHFEPAIDSFFVAGGSYMPPSDLLKKIRQEIDYNANRFLQIIENKEFKSKFGELGGERLKTVPKGYSADNPAIEMLKMKGFVATHHFSKEEVSAPNFDKEIVSTFTGMRPLVDFLNEAMEG